MDIKCENVYIDSSKSSDSNEQILKELEAVKLLLKESDAKNLEIRETVLAEISEVRQQISKIQFPDISSILEQFQAETLKKLDALPKSDDVLEKIRLKISEKLVEFEEKFLEGLENLKEKTFEIRDLDVQMNDNLEMTPPPEPHSDQIPIEQNIIGEWKMMRYDNFDGYQTVFPGYTFERFSENVKFEVADGKLSRISESFLTLTENEENKDLFVDGNHLKSSWIEPGDEVSTVDRSVENDELHVVNTVRGVVFKRVYHRFF